MLLQNKKRDIFVQCPSKETVLVFTNKDLGPHSSFIRSGCFIGSFKYELSIIFLRIYLNCKSNKTRIMG